MKIIFCKQTNHIYKPSYAWSETTSGCMRSWSVAVCGFRYNSWAWGRIQEGAQPLSLGLATHQCWSLGDPASAPNLRGHHENLR